MRSDTKYSELSGDHSGWKIDSLAPPATRLARSDAAVGVEHRDPQLGAVPRHVRVMPLQPRQELAVGADDRIANRNPRLRPASAPAHRSACRSRPGRSWLRCRPRGSRARAISRLRNAIDAVVREERTLIGDRHRRLAWLLPIDALIGEIREIDRALVDRVCAAAVFMHARAHVEGRRRDVADVAIRRAPDDHVAAALRRPALDPIHILAVELNLIEAKRAGGDARSRERRWPGAVGNWGLRHERKCNHFGINGVRHLYNCRGYEPS